MSRRSLLSITSFRHYKLRRTNIGAIAAFDCIAFLVNLLVQNYPNITRAHCILKHRLPGRYWSIFLLAFEVDNEKWLQLLMKIVFNPESILNSDSIGVLKWDNRSEG